MMSKQTFEMLRAGLDLRPWIVIGGLHDGRKVKVSNPHLCEWQMIPIVGKGIEYIVYRIDHDNHVLEYDLEKNNGAAW